MKREQERNRKKMIKKWSKIESILKHWWHQPAKKPFLVVLFLKNISER
jgi:hypothetical protein